MHIKATKPRFTIHPNQRNLNQVWAQNLICKTVVQGSKHTFGDMGVVSQSQVVK